MLLFRLEWQARLSVALQKGNVVCLLQAGRVQGAADLQGDIGWEEDIEDLLRDTAAGAGWALLLRRLLVLIRRLFGAE